MEAIRIPLAIAVRFHREWRGSQIRGVTPQSLCKKKDFTIFTTSAFIKFHYQICGSNFW
ncbi:hypothetical protein H6F93_02885 [Leptolyngbya sp. FACHB-671]|uniref:hypothetical protein n=1 Tax=Leptolyngbya sp. FACHB-671 TaxID=2692812 RepID=UPI001682A69B|nr:hypothetical protein [Leptolyngbya sp. FACHB-671]MBD1867167.1 hypothetical protein [Cyanobacteria bacterium FACHB-471]MBD2066479.1 hypothetical protein [Leptolyngbya sp. FACHB-671]